MSPRLALAQPLRLCLAWSLAGAFACSSDVTSHVPACQDGIKEGTEADVDCGGSCPDKCAAGSTCGADGDCSSDRCVDRTCAPVLPADGPVLQSLDPTWGPEAGGTLVTLSGSGFVVPMTVRFGAGSATEVKVVSSTILTVKSPPGSAGPVDVTVGRIDGKNTTLSGGYLYAASVDVVLTAITPTAGPTTGGTRGMLTGAGLDATAKVYFGGVPATHLTSMGEHQLVFTTPPHAAGRVDVVVMNPRARAGILPGSFLFQAPGSSKPELDAVTPSQVGKASQQPVSATGRHLASTVLVFVGDQPAVLGQTTDAAVTLTVSADMPLGKYDVTVTTADGESATLPEALEIVSGSCDDKARNGAETDIDCGGATCAPCASGKGCGGPVDCAAKVCSGGLCAVPSCSDGAKNGSETDIDCGGASCAPCATGKGCGGPLDCATKACSGGLCAVPSCTDGAKNGDETDIDCGGAACAPCASGKGCGGPLDCATKACSGGLCAVASCSDDTKNGSETDIDCGGAACAPCASGKGCGGPVDCAAKVCSGGLCAVASCSDGVKNGGETDVDCGGSCGPCASGKVCSQGSDCISNSCSGGVCSQNYRSCTLSGYGTLTHGQQAVGYASAGVACGKSCSQSVFSCNDGTLIGGSTYNASCSVAQCTCMFAQALGFTILTGGSSCSSNLVNINTTAGCSGGAQSYASYSCTYTCDLNGNLTRSPGAPCEDGNGACGGGVSSQPVSSTNCPM